MMMMMMMMMMICLKTKSQIHRPSVSLDITHHPKAKENFSWLPAIYFTFYKNII
jgi:hypothetical protein